MLSYFNRPICQIFNQHQLGRHNSENCRMVQVKQSLQKMFSFKYFKTKIHTTLNSSKHIRQRRIFIDHDYKKRPSQPLLHTTAAPHQNPTTQPLDRSH